MKKLVAQLHQIEPTTRCNLRCRYCPSPHLPRAKEDMSWDTFLGAMDLLEHYVKAGTQTEFSFTGIGEPTLHPQLCEMAKYARIILGPDRPIFMSTNGLTFTEDVARGLAEANVGVFVSLHRPEIAGRAIELAKKHQLLVGANPGAAISAFDWAGQVNWFVSHPASRCEWLAQGWGAVMVDGRVTTCCLDADGSGVIGTIKTPPDELAVQVYKHCAKCSFSVPEDMKSQPLAA